MDNVVGIWGIAHSTNCSTLITACLPLLPTDIPRLLELKLSIDHLKEVLQLPSVKDIGGEHQLRLVARWMDTDEATAAQTTPDVQLCSLLPFVDLQSITDHSLFNFMGENNVIITNQQCRLFVST